MDKKRKQKAYKSYEKYVKNLVDKNAYPMSLEALLVELNLNLFRLGLLLTDILERGLKK